MLGYSQSNSIPHFAVYCWEDPMDKQKMVAVPKRADVEELFREFIAEVSLATGKNGKSRARFGGFEVREGPKETYLDAVNAYSKGSFLYAMTTAKRAIKRLRDAQKMYAVRSVSRYFPPRINTIPEHIHQDLYDAVVKKFNEFSELVNSVAQSDEYDLDKLSQLYWGLCDAIEELPRLQEVRDQNARMLAKAGRASKKQAERLEAASAIVKAEEDRRRQKNAQRAQLAAELQANASEFASAI